MKIVLICDNYPPEMNANAAICYDFATHWCQNHTVSVITCQPNFPEGKLFPGYHNRWYNKTENQGVTLIRVKSYMAANQGMLKRMLDFASFMTTSFSAGIIEKQPDIFVAISPQFLTIISAWMLAKIRRKPFVIILCDLWPASIEAVGAIKNRKILRYLEQLEKFMYAQATRIIALSPAFKTNLIQRGITPDKIEVVLSGVDTNAFHPIQKNRVLLTKYHLENKFIIGFVGTLGVAHQLEDVIETANKLNTNPNTHFLLIGTGAKRKTLEQLIKQMQLKHVTIDGPFPQTMIPQYWSLIDLALICLKPHPVFKTVIPTKLLEAMAMGRPILLYAPEGEASKMLAQAHCGIWVDSNKPADLYDTIQMCVHQDLTQYKQNALTYAQMLSRTQQAQRYQTIIESCI